MLIQILILILIIIVLILKPILILLECCGVLDGDAQRLLVAQPRGVLKLQNIYMQIIRCTLILKFITCKLVHVILKF